MKAGPPRQQREGVAALLLSQNGAISGERRSSSNPQASISAFGGGASRFGCGSAVVGAHQGGRRFRNLWQSGADAASGVETAGLAQERHSASHLLRRQGNRQSADWLSGLPQVSGAGTLRAAPWHTGHKVIATAPIGRVPAHYGEARVFRWAMRASIRSLLGGGQSVLRS